MSKLMEELKFNNHYPKLRDYKHCTVIFLISGLTGEIIKQNYETLALIDTLRDDGKYFALDPKQEYLIVFLAGNDGGIFTTIRKDNDENRAKFQVGSFFKIKIEV